MPTQANLLGSGCPPLQCQASVGLIKTALTATGSTQGTAFSIPSDFNVFSTVAASTGAILPATGNNYQMGDSLIIVNHGASALTVYPPVGGTVANGAVNAGFSVPANKTAWFFIVGANTYAASLSS